MATFWEDSGPIQRMIFPARKQHTATVFFLHGLGGSARNIAPYLENLTQHPELDHVKFVLPSAPLMAVTAMDGRTVPSWFDCFSFDHASRTEDETGLHTVASRMHALISKEISDHGIPSERIVIGGLSQGGATSILTMLTSEKQLGGLFGLSTYIPLREKVPEFATPCAKTTPILWSHGNADLQVNYDEWKGFARTLAEQLGIPFRLTESVDVLKKDKFFQNGVQLEFHRYDDLGHFIDEIELKNLGLWVSLRVPGV